MTVAGLCQRDEVRVYAGDSNQLDIAQFHIILYLFQAFVIPQDNWQRQVELGRGNQFLHGKHETTVASKANHGCFRQGELGADGIW